MSHDVMESEEAYEHFYDELGQSYPESEIVYSEALGLARQKVVRHYLRRLAERSVRLLDVGCNDGRYSLYYAARGGAVHGIDISLALIEKARSAARQMHLENATFEPANVEKFSAGPLALRCSLRCLST